eukprot:212071-Amphidinium_carterae.1
MLANSSRSILVLLSSKSLSVVLVLFFCLSDINRSASRLASNSPYLALWLHASIAVPRELIIAQMQFH